jgi:hypothetical protein
VLKQQFILIDYLSLKKPFCNFFSWVSPKPIHFFALMQKSKQKKSRLHFILSSSAAAEVGIIFACKIATFWVIFEPNSHLPKRFPHFAAQK